MQPTGGRECSHFAALRLGPSRMMRAAGLAALSKQQSLGGCISPGQIGDFEWRCERTSALGAGGLFILPKIHNYARFRSKVPWCSTIAIGAPQAPGRALARAQNAQNFWGPNRFVLGSKPRVHRQPPASPPSKIRASGSTPDPSGIGSEARQSPAWC